MRAAHSPRENRLPQAGMQETPAGPLPVRPGRKRKPPLEMHGDWDPWLPPKDAYPDIPAPMRLLASLLLMMLALAAVTVFFAWLGS